MFTSYVYNGGRYPRITERYSSLSEKIQLVRLSYKEVRVVRIILQVSNYQ